MMIQISTGLLVQAYYATKVQIDVQSFAHASVKIYMPKKGGRE